MLKENIEKIFKNYLNSRNEQFANHHIAAVLRRYFPKDLENLTENSNYYKFTGSAGQGNWTHSPWVAVFNKKITESAQSGYYIVYLFREDMKGVYISLNQGMTDLRTQTSNNAKTKEILRSRASDFRHKLQGYLTDQFLDEIDLGVVNSPNAPFYEAGNIIAKYYSAENLPSEDVLEADFREFLSFYDLLAGESVLTIIEDVNVIEDAQNRFIDLIKKLSNKTVSAKAGFQGGQESGEVHWSDVLGIWLMTRKIENSRYWNGFGIHEPSEDAGLTITAEINFPIKGIDRRIAGTFVTDGNEIYVAHRGKLGGNYSKKFFDENYHGKWTKIQDGDRESEVVLIGSLNDPNFPENVRDFIFEVARIKGSIYSSKNWISDYINTVFRRYNGVKSRNEPVKGNKLSQTFLNFKNDLIQFASNLPHENIYNEYEGYSSHQVGGTWSNYPYVYIYDANLRKNDKYGLHPYTIYYYFSEDIQEVYLSLDVNWRYANQVLEDNIGEYAKEMRNDYFKSETKKARSKLSNSEVITKKSDWVTSENPSSPIIYFKSYKKGELPEEEVLKTDLIEILNLYQDLINDIKIEPITEPQPLFTSFYEFFSDQGFYFNPELVENFLLSLKIKPFVILTGNSGTGKTKIAQLFAEYLKKVNNCQHKLVPVGANWTENRHLLGFYNIITKNYQETTALKLIMSATTNLDSPYFLVLDEMNLSHVERYFADFLSAMESNESIPLHSNDDKEIPWELDIPSNLLVIGTVNVDETTYMFSPKVLDRANTIEFSTYPAMNYMLSDQETENPSGDIEYLENPLSDINTRNFTINDLKEKFKDVKINSNDYLWEVLAGEINSFQEALGKAGFDFGFRVINEILRFMYVAWVYEGKPEVWDNWMRYFDAQVKQKMLPKLHGSQRVLEEVLKDIFELCYIDTVDSPPRYLEDLTSDPSVKYLESAKKIQEMDKVLNEQRYVSFIN